ncbi:DUF4345 family protein [Dongshaea marina]|uniref:DUF4345 family protein n=1 Tax=Dongshaea marina TaxID=2047966 RepID=UPI000D3E3043|nr:DUF4345 family protein [Dongshaea marina]
MIDSILQGLVGLSCLFLIGLGAKTMFAPKSMFGILGIEAQGATGLNSIRGFLGGLYLGSSILLAAGLATGNTLFFLAVATTMGTAVIGRLVGIAMDGLDKKVIAPLIAEIVMVTIFITAHLQLGLA